MYLCLTLHVNLISCVFELYFSYILFVVLYVSFNINSLHSSFTSGDFKSNYFSIVHIITIVFILTFNVCVLSSIDLFYVHLNLL